MEITYEVEDGYCGGSRPQHVKIPDDEILDCDTSEEAMKLVEDAIQDHFENKVYPGYNPAQIMAKIMKARASKQEE